MCCGGAFYSHVCAELRFSGHAAIWQGVLPACTSACAAEAELSLPVPLPALPTWRSTSAPGVRAVRLHAERWCVCVTFQIKTARLKCEHSPLLMGDLGAGGQGHLSA